jgi:hypothetical protein
VLRGGSGGGGAGQVETVPETPVRVVAQEQTMAVPGLTNTLGPWVSGGKRESRRVGSQLNGKRSQVGQDSVMSARQFSIGTLGTFHLFNWENEHAH